MAGWVSVCSAREQLTHQDHPEIVGDFSAVRIADQKVVWEAAVEMGRDGLVGVLRRKGGDGRGGGVLVRGGRRLGEVGGGRAVRCGDGDAAG